MQKENGITKIRKPLFAVHELIFTSQKTEDLKTENVSV